MFTDWQKAVLRLQGAMAMACLKLSSIQHASCLTYTVFPKICLLWWGAGMAIAYLYVGRCNCANDMHMVTATPSSLVSLKSRMVYLAFSASMLLVGWQEGHPACKNWVVTAKILGWLSVCSKVQMIGIWSSWCHSHSIISCSLSGTGLPRLSSKRGH